MIVVNAGMPTPSNTPSSDVKLLSITLRLSPRSFSGSSQRVENRSRRRVVGHVPAVGGATARIVVQVDGDLVARRGIDEMLLHVGACRRRTRPLRRSRSRRGSSGADARQRLQDAHRLDDGDDAVGVVGGAGAGRQRIEVGADDHDFVSQHRILAGNLRDHVVAVEIACPGRTCGARAAAAATTPACIIRTIML